MTHEIIKLPQSEIEIKIELNPIEWGEFILQAAKDLSKDVKVEGFRPGFAPLELVEQKIGLGRILEKAADLAVKKYYIKVISDNKIEAISRPEIQVVKIAKDNPFEFKAKVAVMPEVFLADYKAVAKKERKKSDGEIKVEEKEIKDSLGWLQKSRTKYATVNRVAQKGDKVEINFSAKKDGQIFEGGESKNYPLVIGEGHFVPGFEDNLIGLKEGETKNFSLVFLADFKPNDLAGQKIDFEVKMNLVQEAQKPELDDEFAKSLGKFDDLKALKQGVKNGLEEEKKNKEKEIWRTRVIEKISRDSKMEIPEVLITVELEKMIQELQASISQMGLDFKTYLTDIKKTEDDLKKEWQDKAKQRVSAALILCEIADKEKIKPTQEEMDSEIAKLISHYGEAPEIKKQIDIERLKEYTKNKLKNEKVFEFLESF